MWSKILIERVPHHTQRYPTLGDYFEGKHNDAYIKVSNSGKGDFDFAVLIHELVEFYLCKQSGIPEEDITTFDLWYEEERLKGNPECQGEPGEHKDAPYRLQHSFATSMELAMLNELGHVWADYNKYLDDFCETYDKTKD